MASKSLPYAFYGLLLFLLLLPSTSGFAQPQPPHAKIVDIWAYGDVVTDSLTLSHKLNNLRIYCGTEENLPFQQLDYQFLLEGRDKDWLTPFPEGWFFYTDLPPGHYVFRAKCRRKGGEWGKEVCHPFTIRCPWWQTGWAKCGYALLAIGLMAYIFYLLRERIRLHNRLRIEEETKRFRDEFILQAARSFHAPLSIIRSIAEKQKLNQQHPLSKTEIQHLRHSSRQMMEMVENLLEFRPNSTPAASFETDDVMEMHDLPLNSCKVLVVESNKELQDVIERDLLRIFSVVTCSGGDVMSTVVKEKPDAVVIDTRIQEANPFELPTLIKKEKPTIVLLLSDFLTTKDLLRAVQSGADDFVRKPFNCQYLTALLVKRLKDAAKHTATAPALPHGNNGQEVADDVVGSPLEATGVEQGNASPRLIKRRSDKLFLQRLQTTVSSNLSSSTFDVNALSAAINLSRAQLNVLTKRLTGMSPSEYIRSCRLAAAASLIETTNLTIQEIMFRIGMADANCFYRRFKEKYGTTPNAYRK